MASLLSRLFGFSKSSQTFAKRMPFELGLEVLENRLVPSVTLSQGILTINGGSGNDTVVIDQNASTGALKVTENGTVHSYTNAQVFGQMVIFYGNDGNDSFTNNSTLSSHAYGGNGNDTMYGGYRRDLLDGGRGNDTMFGRQDVDTMYAGPADDVNSFDWMYGGEEGSGNPTTSNYMFGSGGADNMLGSTGNDYMFGYGGNDTLFGGGGDDQLDGGDGHDKMYGGEGNDYLDAGTGNDQLDGGYGNDTCYGGTGDDYVYAGTDRPENFNYLYGGDGNDILQGGVGNDALIAGNGNDTLTGGYGNDYLYGQAGDDFLYGGAGNDYLLGGDGKDFLYGEDGNDVLDGSYDGYGDRLIGGKGADHFGIEPNDLDYPDDYSPYVEKDTIAHYLPRSGRLSSDTAITVPDLHASL